jgi:hypothetical protein
MNIDHERLNFTGKPNITIVINLNKFQDKNPDHAQIYILLIVINFKALPLIMHNSALRKQKMHMYLKVTRMKEEKFHLQVKLPIILNLYHIQFRLHRRMEGVLEAGILRIHQLEKVYSKVKVTIKR